MKTEEPWSWLVIVFVILWSGQPVFVLVPGGTSRFREFSKDRNELINRVRPDVRREIPTICP